MCHRLAYEEGATMTVHNSFVSTAVQADDSFKFNGRLAVLRL